MKHHLQGAIDVSVRLYECYLFFLFFFRLRVGSKTWFFGILH